MTKGSLALMVLLATCRPTYAQTGPTGTWRAVGATGGSWEVVLRVDGTSLNGVVSSCASAGQEIRGGRVDGNTITFSCRAPDRERSISFTGTLQGDAISFSWTMRNPTGVLPTNENFFRNAPPRFSVTRVPDSALAAIADEVRGAEFAAAVNLPAKDVKVEGTLLVPATVRRVRALIVVTKWGLGEDFYNDRDVLPLLQATESALLLARFSDMSAKRFRNVFAADGADGLVSLLERLAQETGHSELKDVPLLVWGHSAGGGGFIAESLPQRTIGLVLYHTGVVFKPGGNADLKVRSQIPALFVAGGKDPVAPPNLMHDTMVKMGRAVGAPWTFAVEPDAPHGSEEHRKRANALMLPWIAAVLRMRLPQEGVALLPVTDGSAWMGDVQTGRVARASAFSGSKSEASWLPDEQSARGWQVVMGVAQ